MEFNSRDLDDALPANLPPLARVPFVVQAEVGTRRLFLDGENIERRQRSAFWTYAVQSELSAGQEEVDFEERGQALWMAMKPSVVVGLVPSPDNGRIVFGLVLVVPRQIWPKNESIQRLGTIRFSRLEAEFPGFLIHGAVELHNTYFHPDGGTSTCSARCNKTGQYGILTAGHCVPNSPVGHISFNGGQHISRAYRARHPPIDAAFVVTPHWSSGSAISSIDYPTAGDLVTVSSRSGAEHRVVAGVQQSMGAIATSAFGIQVFLDRACSRGDSGALVATNDGSAVGIYSGELAVGSTTGRFNYGMAQHFGQAKAVLDIETFQ